MKNLFVYLVLIAPCFFTLSCTEDETAEIFPADQDVILKDIRYGSHERQKMDVYLPADRSRQRTKTAVFIHGGGWIAGSKDDLPFNGAHMQTLKAHFPNFAFVTLNYRLATSSDHQFPAAEEDIVRAMNYLYNNLDAYQLSDDTYMIGGSAGAHLAALYTLKHDADGRIKGCIGVSGAYNLISLYQTGNEEAKAILEAVVGGTPEQKPQAYEQASPVNFVSPDAPKFLILHGKQDALTPIGQAIELAAALDANGVAHTSFTYSGGHGIPGEHFGEAITYLKAFLN